MSERPDVTKARNALYGTGLVILAVFLYAGILMFYSTKLYAQEVDFSAVEMKWKTCAACHGNKAQGKPGFPGLSFLEEDQITEALQDYKAGVYRGDQSVIMFGQAATLSDEEVELMAKYIEILSNE